MKLYLLVLISIFFISCSSNKDKEALTEKQNTPNLVISDSTTFTFPEAYPVTWGQVAVLDTISLFLFWSATSPLLEFDREGGCLGKVLEVDGSKNAYKMPPHGIIQNRKGNYNFLSSGYLTWYLYDSTFNLKERNEPQYKGKSASELGLMLSFAKENITGYYDSVNALYWTPLESTIADVSLTKFENYTIAALDSVGNIVRLFGTYPREYLEDDNKVLLNHRKLSIAVSPIKEIIYQSAPASHRIQVYDYNGKRIKEFGVEGQNIKDKNTKGFKSQLDYEKYDIDYFNSDYYYSSIKCLGDTVFRTYVVDCPLSKVADLKHGQFSKSSYLQVYVKDKLLGEVLLPTQISPIILKITETGQLVFRNKFIAVNGEEDIPVRLYYVDIK